MMILTELSPGVWSHEVTLPLPLGVRMPLRMTVLRLPSGKVLVHNPVKLDDQLAEAIERCGPVAELAAPNLFHHLFLEPAARRWPTAAVRGPQGLAAKKKGLAFAGEFGDVAPLSYEGVVETQPIHGAPGLNEVTFFHRPSGTLLVSDLVFNIREPDNGVTSLVLRMMGTRGRLAASRWWRVGAKDKQGVARSLERVLAWDFTRVLMAHGDPLETDAHAEMKRALTGLRGS
jgi:hypothetical protein